MLLKNLKRNLRLNKTVTFENPANSRSITTMKQFKKESINGKNQTNRNEFLEPISSYKSQNQRINPLLQRRFKSSSPKNIGKNQSVSVQSNLIENASYHKDSVPHEVSIEKQKMNFPIHLINTIKNFKPKDMVKRKSRLGDHFKSGKYVKPFNELGIHNVEQVGGKNASLGEMVQHLMENYQSKFDNKFDVNLRVPLGFAITVDAYHYHMKENDLTERIQESISEFRSFVKQLDPNDSSSHKKKIKKLYSTGEKIREMIINAPIPKLIEDEIRTSYKELEDYYGEKDIDVALRSSATAEDLDDASFAGQQDTYLNVRGPEQVIKLCKNIYASLFTNRAISYRLNHKFEEDKVGLSIGIQKMVRSDLSSSGVMFTLDTESGFRDVALITSAYGLGESIVQGIVTPDEFYVHKPTLTQGFSPMLKKSLGVKNSKLIYSKKAKNEDNLEMNDETTETVDVSEKDRNTFSISDEDVLELAKMATIIEQHYGKPMDIEWAKDGIDQKLYIVQARPETVQSLKMKKDSVIEEYILQEKPSKVLCHGRSVGSKIVTAKARVFKSKDLEAMSDLKPGEILVTDTTDPDLEPTMRIASGIITQKGGRTSHAAIISREIGIAAVVGADEACKSIKDGQYVTIDCSNGDIGYIYDGKVKFEKKVTSLKSIPETPTDIMINIANPNIAFQSSQLPVKGVGLARMEFIINNAIEIHPMALVHPELVKKAADKKKMMKLLSFDEKYVKDPKQFFVDKLAQGCGMIAGSFYPRPVIIRMSDFKSNEYRQLLCGEYFEPDNESNPMIGFRGASRYFHKKYKEAFKLECMAMKKLREEMGFTNVKLMIPFVRTVDEAKKVISLMEEYGLKRGENGLELYMMVEIPSNVILIDEFSKLFDGFSIGSNDLTQTTLAIDRDSELVAPLFDERDEAVKKMISMAIKGAKRNKRKIGICGQGPSQYMDFAEFLSEEGIDSISLTGDSVIKTILDLSEHNNKNSKA